MVDQLAYLILYLVTWYARDPKYTKPNMSQPKSIGSENTITYHAFFYNRKNWKRFSIRYLFLLSIYALIIFSMRKWKQKPNSTRDNLSKYLNSCVTHHTFGHNVWTREKPWWLNANEWLIRLSSYSMPFTLITVVSINFFRQ